MNKITPNTLPPTPGVNLTRFLPVLEKAIEDANFRTRYEFSAVLTKLADELSSKPVATTRALSLPADWAAVPRFIGICPQTVSQILATLRLNPEATTPDQAWHPAIIQTCQLNNVYGVYISRADQRSNGALLGAFEPTGPNPMLPAPMTTGMDLSELANYAAAAICHFEEAGEIQEVEQLNELIKIISANPVATAATVTPPPCWAVVPREMHLTPDMIEQINNMSSTAQDQRAWLRVFFGQAVFEHVPAGLPVKFMPIY